MKIPYQAFAAHLKSLEVLASPAELHAQASAMLCFNADTHFKNWLQLTMADFCLSETAPEAVTEVFSAVFELAKKELKDPEYGYYLILPDDNDDLAIRLKAVSDWVNAFLSGIGQAGFSYAGLTEESREFISDLNAIGQLDNQVEGVESDELDYQQVVEYIRCGVMLLYTELNHIQPASQRLN
ncbi:UPF0149 family protein [Marinicella gelatinilytica]|uniref:UPF0149 family protein n=1 Tax=Marinicella gelatinilytica TaxID=2996017 RepID=UPI002260AE5B|nr:UPF0149 family protein [Marinicella gelatinilytica]MCX7545977.1 UPF0149 family protein [Marinicella gelatinilytica]